MTAIVLKSFVFDRMTDEEFVAFCLEQRELKVERTSEGEIILMSPTFSQTGETNGEVFFQLALWNKAEKSGRVFDSSTGFTLPNQAMRSPDAAWIANERWNALTPRQRNSFAPICPDFLVELKSQSDTVEDLIRKIRGEWLPNGCRLAWLIDPDEEEVYVFRADGSQDEISGFDGVVSGETVLPGFELDLKELRR
ncbi:MAG: Uma2 family endonuclease [Ferruginibacter sp.]|nr:Uma2 family endonuclease [Cytophagales bacterium]